MMIRANIGNIHNEVKISNERCASFHASLIFPLTVIISDVHAKHHGIYQLKSL